MKGIYTTKEGQKVEVVDFDEANKIAMIKLDELQSRWVSEDEYLSWVKEGCEIVLKEAVEETEEKVVKKKAAPKKKDK